MSPQSAFEEISLYCKTDTAARMSIYSTALHTLTSVLTQLHQLTYSHGTLHLFTIIKVYALKSYWLNV